VAGYPPGDGWVERLDVEQDQVRGVQQRSVGAGAKVSGGIECGVQVEFLWIAQPWIAWDEGSLPPGR
jgi:hypothetical protein